VYSHGKKDLAEATMIKLHKDKSDPTDSFARREFIIMAAQLDLESKKSKTTWQALQIPSVRKRFILAFLTMMGTQCSGLIVLLSKFS
jgi:putative Ca2+/H+ antiporter (TMEM165/GDT1 family)